MRSNPYFRYYQVFKNDTAVTEISANNFRPIMRTKFKRGLPSNILVNEGNGVDQFYYALPPDDLMFYGYLDKAHAMEKAKAGAQAYISSMVSQVEQGILKLTKYRNDHYEDLNINLLDVQIRKFRKSMNLK